MRTKILDITPKMAEEMLAKSKVNRVISADVVDMYADDFKRKKWMLVGDPIRFSVNGTLQDGHHRLHAVIQSGMTVKFLVVYDLPEDAIWYIDVGRPRRPAQIFHMKGMANASRQVAIARTVDSLEFGETHVKRSMDTFRTIFRRHPGIAWIIEQPGAKNNGPLCRSGVLAAFALVQEKVNGKADSLWKQFSEGSNLDPGDPLLVLSKYLISTTGQGGAGVPIQDAKRTLTSCSMKLAGKKQGRSYINEAALVEFLPKAKQTIP